MKNKLNGYILLTTICGIIALVISSLISFFGIYGKTEEILSTKYKTYSYYEYIDRTSTMTFTSNGGGQLYEAEKSKITGGCYIEDNEFTSGDSVINVLVKGSTFEFEIESDSSSAAEVIINLCYLSDTNRDTEVENLFVGYINNVEMGMRHSIVSKCYNEFDFKENIMCEVLLQKGKNKFEFIATGRGYKVDYIALVAPLNRTSSDSTIGAPVFPFEKNGVKQIYQAERMYFDGFIVVNDNTCSGYQYLKNNNENSEILFSLNCDSNTYTNLSIAISVNEINIDLKNVFNIYINNVSIELISKELQANEKFIEINLANISLITGLNIIKIICFKNISIDYLSLNNDINYSNLNNACKYEAENAILLGSSQIKKINDLTNEIVVCCNSSKDNLIFNICTSMNSYANLSIKLSYSGIDCYLNDLFFIKINNKVINVPSSLLEKTNGLKNIYLGLINLNSGNNTILLQATKPIEIDNIVLSYNSSIIYKKYEAERGILNNGCLEEHRKEASNEKDVGYNKVGSSVCFYIYCDEELNVSTWISLSCVLYEDIKMNSCINIKLNDNEINISNYNVKATNSWCKFNENYCGKLKLKKGINVIEIISIAEIYNFDYIRLFL